MTDEFPCPVCEKACEKGELHCTRCGWELASGLIVGEISEREEASYQSRLEIARRNWRELEQARRIPQKHTSGGLLDDPKSGSRGSEQRTRVALRRQLRETVSLPVGYMWGDEILEIRDPRLVKNTVRAEVFVGYKLERHPQNIRNDLSVYLLAYCSVDASQQAYQQLRAICRQDWTRYREGEDAFEDVSEASVAGFLSTEYSGPGVISSLPPVSLLPPQEFNRPSAYDLEARRKYEQDLYAYHHHEVDISTRFMVGLRSQDLVLFIRGSIAKQITIDRERYTTVPLQQYPETRFEFIDFGQCVLSKCLASL